MSALQNIITSVERIVIDHPGRWTLIYVIGKQLQVMIRNRRECTFGGVITVEFKDLDDYIKDQLEVIITKAMGFASNQSTTAGFQLIDLLKGWTITVNYNNCAGKIELHYHETKTLQPIFWLAGNIVDLYSYRVNIVPSII